MDVRNEKYLSTVNVPVAISMADIEQQINAQVNGLIYEDNSLDNQKAGANTTNPLHAKVWKQGTITVRADGDSLFRFTVPLKIWAKAGIKILGFTQYQETTFAINLRFITRFGLDPDWSVSTQTTADGYDWVTKPTTRLVGFNVPITSFVSRMIDKNLGTITQTLDQQVRRNVDIRTPVLRAWNLLREPYLLAEKYKTWLMVVPRRVLITPLRFTGNAVQATIGIEGYTLTTTGTRPEVHPATTLPALTVVPTVPDDFKVGILSEAPYAEAAQLVAAEFVGKSFSFRDGQYTIRITDIDLYGHEDNLVIKAGLAGSITGHIYLKGHPYYDPVSKTIELKDLTYDLDTRNLLQRAANWLLQGMFVRKLQEQLSIPVGSQLDEVRQAVQTRLKNSQLTKGVTLNGTIDEVTPEGVYLTPTALLAVVYAKGRVNVRVEGLQ